MRKIEAFANEQLATGALPDFTGLGNFMSIVVSLSKLTGVSEQRIVWEYFNNAFVGNNIEAAVGAYRYSSLSSGDNPCQVVFVSELLFKIIEHGGDSPNPNPEVEVLNLCRARLVEVIAGLRNLGIEPYFEVWGWKNSLHNSEADTFAEEIKKELPQKPVN